MNRRLVLLGLLGAMFLFAIAGEKADLDGLRFLAGLFFIAVVVVGVSFFWRPKPLPAMPGLFPKPGPGETWDAGTGQPAKAPAAPRRPDARK